MWVVSHPSPVLIRPGAPALIETMTKKMAGTPLGVMEGYPYEAFQVGLQPGDTLFIFSDGAYEITKKDGGMLQFEEFLSHLTDATHSNHDLDHTIMFARNLSGRYACAVSPCSERLIAGGRNTLTVVPTASAERGAKKLGQPVPLSNLCSDENSGSSQPAHW